MQKSTTCRDPSILGGNFFVAPSILKWAQSYTGLKSSIYCLLDLSEISGAGVPHYRPWVPRGYQNSDGGILPRFFGEEWSVAPLILKWERTSSEANAFNRPLEEITCRGVPSHFHSWVPIVANRVRKQRARAIVLTEKRRERRGEKGQ